MAFAWWDMWIKGIRVKTLQHLLLIMARYCTGYENVPFIDFYGRYGHGSDRKVLNNVKDVVELLMKKEDMSKRRAYDYATAIKRIQFMTF